MLSFPNHSSHSLEKHFANSKEKKMAKQSFHKSVRMFFDHISWQPKSVNKQKRMDFFCLICTIESPSFTFIVIYGHTFTIQSRYLSIKVSTLPESNSPPTLYAFEWSSTEKPIKNQFHCFSFHFVYLWKFARKSNQNEDQIKAI